jgi:hypothetical protein
MTSSAPSDHCRDVGAEVLCQLDGCRSDRSRRAVDEDAAAFRDIGLAEACEGEGCPVEDRGRLFEAHVGRLVRYRPGLSYTQELRVGAGPFDSEDLVSGLELRDSVTDLLDLAGELHAEDPVLRPAQAGDEARDG